MRALLIASLALPLLAQTPKPSFIEGRVIDAATGMPLRKANLSLRPAGGQPGQPNRTNPGAQGQIQQQAEALRDLAQNALNNANGRPRQLATVTDAEGRFSFAIDRAGDYRISADRTGYVRGEFGSRRPGGNGRAVHVNEGQRVSGIDVRLTPQGVIAGRVVDEDGDPVERAQINVTTRPDATGNVRSSSTVTNDLGEFRIAGLGMGKYYLMATRIGIAQQEDPQQGQETFAVTYFPGVTDAASASVIALSPGQQVTGIFIPLRKTRVFRVTGIISGSIGDETQPQAQQQPGPRGERRGPLADAIRGTIANRVIVNLQERADSNAPNIGRRMTGIVQQDGTFQVPNVPPGSYWAVATTQTQRGAITVGRAAVDIRNANASGIVLSIAPPVTVTGTARPDGREAVDLTKGSVQFTPVVDGQANTTGVLLQNGAFQSPVLSRLRYRVSATGMADGVYLKSVRVNGADVTKTGIDLANAPQSYAIELTFSPKAASVSGSIKLGKENLPGRVMLVPDPYNPSELPVPAQAGIVGVPVTVSDTGSFTLKNVPPGSYRLYAFEDVDLQAIDTAMLRRLESRATRVTLSESASSTVEVTQILAEESID